MKSTQLVGIVGLLLAAGMAGAQPAGKRAGPEDGPKEGSAAPAFALRDAAGKKEVQLTELRGKPAVLIFGSCT